MSKIAIFFLIIVNLLPISSTSKAKTEDYLRSKFSYKTSSSRAANVDSTSTKYSLIPEPKGQLASVERGKGQIAVDMATGAVISENNADARLQIASLTKLMTAYVSMKDMPLDKQITVGSYNLRPGDAVMGVNVGETLSFESLLKGLLINSGSDAAQAIAIADSGNVDSFVAKMNRASNDLGLKNTHFANPVGWDDSNNYSSARDLAQLSRTLLNNQTFRKIVATGNATVRTNSGRSISLTNTDILLSDPNFLGVKTGYTPGAVECLVSLNLGTGREILSVIIGSGDRFGQTRAFFDWINSNFVLK